MLTLYGCRSKISVLIILAFCLFTAPVVGQQPPTWKWWNPVQSDFQTIEGQAWAGEMEAFYHRLPARAARNVGQRVWGLSKQAAGLMIRFRSNAADIVVRYGTQKGKGRTPVFSMDHMPATGVSGIDLYAIDSNGEEKWCAGKRHFADTITYRFAALNRNDDYHQEGREYRLYLPLYSQVEWLEIGVGGQDQFSPLPVRPARPIVVYGTSIAQGACASRPGMAWTSMLGRKMDRPLVNLGFSGSAHLETSVVELMAEIDAKIFILDCLPNLPLPAWSNLGISNGEEIKERVRRAVRLLKTKRPKVPILLVDHAGYTEERISDVRQKDYQQVNLLQQAAFYELLQEGHEQLYYLTKEEIDLQMDDMVDGVHPTDLGMAHYAKAYEQKLRSVLKEPVGQASTTKPCTQFREPGNYDWEARHRAILKLNAEDPPKIVFLANSIIHFWGGLPKTKLVREEESWQNLLTPAGVRNAAYGWDRIENVLWRVYHGELDGFDADKVWVMIGTNNLHLNTDDEILAGLELLVRAIRQRQPNAALVLMGLLPRRGREKRVAALNREIGRLAGRHHLRYADLGDVFLGTNGKIDEQLFSDGLHPNADGYRKLREKLEPFVNSN